MVDDMLKHPCEHPEEARADARYSEGDSDCPICQGLLRHWCKHPEEAYADARYKKGDTLCPACDGLVLPLLDRAQRAAPRPAWERAAEGCAWAGVGPHAAARPAARAYCFCKDGVALRRTEELGCKVTLRRTEELGCKATHLEQRASQRQAPHLETDMARQYEVRPPALPPRPATIVRSSTARRARERRAAGGRGGAGGAAAGAGGGTGGSRVERAGGRVGAGGGVGAGVGSAGQVPPVLANARRGTAAWAPGRRLAAWVPGRGRR
jgi:hypothetical protein